MPCANPGRRSPWPDAVLLRRLVAAALMLASLFAGRVQAADERFLLEGLADGEACDTGTRSYYLSRNGGDAATERRLRLWVAAQIAPGLQGMVLGRAEGGDIGDYYSSEGGTTTELEQAWLRYTMPAGLTLQAGKMVEPIGSFNHRYLSNQNPLIGSPAGYMVDYPVGVELTGSAGRADFLLALVDRPLSRQIYLPEPSSTYRPAVEAGITPFVGFRVGGYATWGTYLSREVEPFIPPGRSWRDYQQRVVGLDVQFSRGHFELNGEATRSQFELPGEHDETGFVYYLEPKYTWSPRLFTALRLERNETASVWLPWNAGWYVTDEAAWDVEAGIGYRIDPRTLVKVSYRVERATDDPTTAPDYDHSLAVQLSLGFDVRSWFDRPR